MMIKNLSGFTVCKNALSLDYAIRECVESLLAICEEVVVGEMGSTDGTQDFLRSWAAVEPRLRIVPVRDWTLEKGNMHWWVSALNETRLHLKCPMALQLDADEVISDDRKIWSIIAKCVAEGDAIAMNRLNFARDAHSLIPEGECVGKFVVRCGPSDLHWVSDEPHQPGQVPLLDKAHIEPDCFIFHLGFLRTPAAFFAKAKIVGGAFFNEYDSRLKEAEERQETPLGKFPWWNRLTSYHGYYPASVRSWMTERGYNV